MWRKRYTVRYSYRTEVADKAEQDMYVCRCGCKVVYEARRGAMTDLESEAVSTGVRVREQEQMCRNQNATGVEGRADGGWVNRCGRRQGQVWRKAGSKGSAREDRTSVKAKQKKNTLRIGMPGRKHAKQV